MHKSIETNLKTVRKEKHKEYLRKVNITPFSLRNDVMMSDNPNIDNVSKFGNVNKHETSFSITDSNSGPPSWRLNFERYRFKTVAYEQLYRWGYAFFRG